jgi:hypothetical protein
MNPPAKIYSLAIAPICLLFKESPNDLESGVNNIKFTCNFIKYELINL